jgi:hypothetical protein
MTPENLVKELNNVILMINSSDRPSRSRVYSRLNQLTEDVRVSDVRPVSIPVQFKTNVDDNNAFQVAMSEVGDEQRVFIPFKSLWGG